MVKEARERAGGRRRVATEGGDSRIRSGRYTSTARSDRFSLHPTAASRTCRVVERAGEHGIEKKRSAKNDIGERPGVYMYIYIIHRFTCNLYTRPVGDVNRDLIGLDNGGASTDGRREEKERSEDVRDIHLVITSQGV